ncbi:prepilin peptidase [Vibrio sp. NFV-1]|uniref:Prepilin peptidase n=2 Tax=Vibrio nitrifigilis TaxID=2789781 RepID=A0ABS0GIG3_9VIBR|nr:prepilin peptidase [Vibrio nitrifigilis]
MYSDITQRTVKHRDLVLSSIFIFSLHQEYQIDINYPMIFLFFIGGMIFWKLGICGAGDIKLLTILSLGMSQQWLLLCVVIMLFLGGVTAGGLLLYSKCSGRKEIVNHGVPYAIPIVFSFGFGIILTFLSK